MEGNWHHVTTVENLGGLKRKIDVNYDIVGTEMAINKASEQIAPKVAVKGFRKGKAPANLVRNFYRRDVEMQAANMLATEGFLHACFENKIVPLSQPTISKAEFKIDGSFFCEIVVDQKPTITPIGYIGLDLKRPKINSQEIYDQLLLEYRNNNKKELQKEVVEDGDVAVVDYMVMDKKNNEISNGKDQRFFVRKGQEPPFGENLLGKVVGEEHEGEVALPENFKDRAGELVNVFIKIKNIVSSVELNDEALAKEIGIGTVEALYDAIRNQTQVEVKNRVNQILQETVIDRLLELNEFEIPEEWVKDEEKYLYQQLGFNGSDDGIKQYVEGMATRNVRRTFILDAIYDVEQQLAVKPEEIETVIQMEAEKKGVSSIIVKEEIEKNNMMESIVGLIKNRKVMDFVLGQAQIVDEEENQNISIIDNV